jgi:hypothetical protein
MSVRIHPKHADAINHEFTDPEAPEAIEAPQEPQMPTLADILEGDA